MKINYMTWDVSEGPDVEEINECLNGVYDGKHCPFVAEVDTHQDACAFVFFSREPEDETAAQKYFDAVVAEYFDAVVAEMSEEPKA